MGFKLTLAHAGRKIAKNAPGIYTTAGILGLGATAILAYKSKPKVEKVVEYMEETQEMELEPDYNQIGTELIKALWLPITVGVLSVGSIVMSHRISRGRILALSGALAAQQAQNIWMETKYRTEHGEEKYQEFITPVQNIEIETEGKDGKKKISKGQIKTNMDATVGSWYSDSTEYVSDDHTYNLAYIESVEATLQTRLFQKGTLLLNAVREELGLERTPNGALLGWTTADHFDISTTTSNVGVVEEGETLEQIWVKWSTPRYIYDEVDLNGGRYSN